MSGKSVAEIVGGAVFLVIGAAAIFHPASAFRTILIIAGILIIVYGVFQIAGWSKRKNIDFLSPADLVSGVISLVIGILFVFSLKFRNAVSDIYAVIMGISVAVGGIALFISGVSDLKQISGAGKAEFVKFRKNSVIKVILGIVFAAIGILIIAKPESLIKIIGYFIGILILSGGIALIADGVSKRNEDKDVVE